MTKWENVLFYAVVSLIVTAVLVELGIIPKESAWLAIILPEKP